MKHKDGSKNPSYNCQVAVDEKEQIIVSADVVNEENDLHQMEPMIQNVKNRNFVKDTKLFPRNRAGGPKHPPSFAGCLTIQYQVKIM
jgi:hypothetical protein